MNLLVIIVLSVVGLLTAPDSLTAFASENLVYRCAVGNISPTVTMIPEEGRAVYKAPDRTFSLRPYGPGTFVNDGESASFEPKGFNSMLWFGDAAYPCQPDAKGTPPPVNTAAPPIPAEQLNIVGQSLGGRLRAGPGTNYRKTGSIREGTWLTILSNTGVRFDGYDWFEVVLDNGLRGFQWGGIMCSNGPKIAGIFASCQSVPGSRS